MAADNSAPMPVPINWHFTAEEAGYILAGLRGQGAGRPAICWRRSRRASGRRQGAGRADAPEIAVAYNVPEDKRRPDGPDAGTFVAAGANTEPPKATRGS